MTIPIKVLTINMTFLLGLLLSSGIGNLWLVIDGSIDFAGKYMKIWRYKQIGMAFHPEPTYVGLQSGDKGYQLRHALNVINAASA